MEAYKFELLNNIVEGNPQNAEELELLLPSYYKINRNKNGKIHSEYINDGYSPALIQASPYGAKYFYLFDGYIRDCVHPFYIEYDSRYKIKKVLYYSSERIKNNEPICINIHYCYSLYNLYEVNSSFYTVLDEYPYHKECEAEYRDYTLHEDMDRKFPFKFAD